MIRIKNYLFVVLFTIFYFTYSSSATIEELEGLINEVDQKVDVMKPKIQNVIDEIVPKIPEVKKMLSSIEEMAPKIKDVINEAVPKVHTIIPKIKKIISTMKDQCKLVGAIGRGLDVLPKNVKKVLCFVCGMSFKEKDVKAYQAVCPT